MYQVAACESRAAFNPVSTSYAEDLMHCVYCGVDYSFDDPCLCMPRVHGDEVSGFTRKVKGPWGETVAEWSFEPGTGTTRWVLMVAPAEA